MPWFSTLGIPGTPTCELFIGGMMMYGIRPGSDLFSSRGDLVWITY